MIDLERLKELVEAPDGAMADLTDDMRDVGILLSDPSQSVWIKDDGMVVCDCTIKVDGVAGHFISRTVWRPSDSEDEESFKHLISSRKASCAVCMKNEILRKLETESVA